MTGASGRSPGMARSEFWTEQTVRWYARALARSDYADAVLGALGPGLAACRDALDVGAGTGALSLPLARRLSRVTALEPTATMAAEIRRAAALAGLANLSVVEATWEEARPAPHDLVLCAHVSGLLRPGSAFLREAGEVARRLVALVRDAPGPGGEDKFFFRELYPLLLGRPYEHRCEADDTLAALGALGIEPAVRYVEYRSDQPFTDLEEACDFFMAYLGLEAPEARDFLRGFLERRLRREQGEWIAPFPKRAAVITWTPAGPPPRARRAG
jgi:SAM-dependent methyltransferase